MSGGASQRVALAAGGTGGHMFPALALARALIARGHSVMLFTDRRSGGFGDALPEVPTAWIAAGGLAGTGPMKRLSSLARLGTGYLQAARAHRRYGSDIVVGFGGYASVPAALSGAHLGVALVLHEQNAVLGRANRMLAPRARAIATSFPQVEGLSGSDRSKVCLTGNPVRAAFTRLGTRPYALPAAEEALNLLVVGGSLGAQVFNSVVPAAVGALPAPLRQRLRVAQQVRGGVENQVAAAYDAAGVACELAPFFDDMAARLERAHLVIGRAGASTVAELASAGRPAILVPFPAATDDHQSVNARHLAESGGAWVIPQPALTPEALGERLEGLLGRPERLLQAAQAVRGLAHPDAAERLADLVAGALSDNGDPLGSPSHREVAA